MVYAHSKIPLRSRQHITKDIATDTMALLKLPYEMVSYVLDHLDLEDVWQLSLTCRRLRSLVTESHIAKRLLEVLSCHTVPLSFLLWTKLILRLRHRQKHRQRQRLKTPSLSRTMPTNFDACSSAANPSLRSPPTWLLSLALARTGYTKMADCVTSNRANFEY